MEDLAGSVQGDQFAGSTLEEAELAIEQAVGLHAPRWGDLSVTRLAAFQEPRQARAERMEQYYQACLPGCFERLGHRFDDDVTSLLRGFASVVRPWALGPGTPPTIVHGDFRPDNFLLGRTAEAPPLAVVDWQTVHHGLAACDIAYLIGGAFPPEQRASVEGPLLNQYVDRLVAAGVDYTFDQAWRDYRWGTLHGVLIAVLATVMAEKTERGDDMLSLMAIRHAKHAVDLDAMALLVGAAI
jgi:aminoglycoside phosphotransferase (APT) family kinase protein